MVFPRGLQQAVATGSHLIRPCLTLVEREMQQHFKPGTTMTLVIQSTGQLIHYSYGPEYYNTIHEFYFLNTALRAFFLLDYSL